MGFFKGIASAKPVKRGQYFKEGRYKVKVKGFKVVESQQGSDTYAVIECEVLESNNADIHVGDDRSQVIDLGKPTGLPNVKRFIGATLGVDATEPGANEAICAYWSKALDMKFEGDEGFEKISEMLVTKAQPLTDLEMDLECVTVPTRKDGEFTIHNWIPIVVE